MKKRRPTAFIICFCMALLCAAYTIKLNNDSESLVNVKCFTLRSRQCSSQLGGAGVLKEAAYAGYYFDIPVKVGRIHVKTGDFVAAGAPLFDIDLQATEEAVRMLAAGLISYSDSSETKTVTEAAKLSALNTMTGIQLMRKVESLKQTVTAEYDCVISAVNCNENAFSNIFKPLICVSDVSYYTAVVTLTQSAVSRIDIGSNAVVTGIFSEREYHAVVENIALRAQSASTTKEAEFEVTLRISKTDELFHPNAAVTVMIDYGTGDNELFIGYDCLVFDGGRTYVYICKDGKAAKTEVKTGNTYYNGVEITSGITDGDVIIYNPASELYNGCSIEVIQ